MAARGYYGHSSPEGDFADARITAAGYDWSAWAENLARGATGPEAVVEDWRDGSMHEQNMLDCRYRDTGVATVPGPGRQDPGAEAGRPRLLSGRPDREPGASSVSSPKSGTTRGRWRRGSPRRRCP
ncbi:hypothetical protein STANM309S_01196 [Streptomyces tanashiensis]